LRCASGDDSKVRFRNFYGWLQVLLQKTIPISSACTIMNKNTKRVLPA
jgi:hypothetical protein